MTVDWRTLRDHRPAGAYLPVGALDGDCRQGDGEWPCPAAVAALETYGFERDEAAAPTITKNRFRDLTFAADLAFLSGSGSDAMRMRAALQVVLRDLGYTVEQ